MRLLILFALLITFLPTRIANAQSSAEIKFDDGVKLSALDSYLDGEKNKIDSITEKEFTAEFHSIRKANYVFNNKTLHLLNKKKPLLARQIAKINSAYEMKQDGDLFGFAAFNSIDYDKFRNCDEKSLPCKIKCKAFLITIDDGGKKENVLVIKSIVKIK